MESGRELDALVAEKVMGLKQILTPGGIEVGWSISSKIGASSLKPYSTDIAAAWKVVEKLNLLDKNCLLHDEGKWSVCPFDGAATIYAGIDAETAPHAICLAALKAVGWKL